MLALVVLYEDMQHLTHTVSNVTAELHHARREVSWRGQGGGELEGAGGR